MVPPFTLDTSGYSEEAKKIAKEELNETQENVEKALTELRELLRNDDSIYFKTDDDDFLKIFLRPCKFYAKSTYELMKRIADFKEKYKDSLKNLLLEDEKSTFIKQNIVNVLTNRDHKGRRVVLIDIGSSWNTNEVTTTQLFRMAYLAYEVAILECETQVRGLVIIMNFDGFGMKQATSLTPSFIMQLLCFAQEAMPLRLKEVHIVREPFTLKLGWHIIKPCINEKLGKRIFFHGSDMTKLHKFIPPSHLPADYRGDLPKIDYGGKDWYPAMENHVDFIKEMNMYGVVSKI